MKCTICGCETPQLSNRQKYCPECAWRAAKETQKRWRENHSSEVRQKYCLGCGKPLEYPHKVCDECKAEYKRTYQREYKRAYRARQKAKEASQ